MPVRKYRSLEAAEESLWRDPDEPGLLAAIRRVWAFSMRLAPRRFPPGVYKYRSIEDANQQREEWEQARVTALCGSPSATNAARRR